MADIDASKYNLSVSQTREHNITWVLRKYRIDLERYPAKEDEAIRIKTYAEPYRNLFLLAFVQIMELMRRFPGFGLYMVGSA